MVDIIYKILGTKKSNNLNCVACIQVFEKGPKLYGHTNVFTKVPKKDYTPSEAFNLLGVSVSPIQVKDKYCCSKYTSIVRDYFGAHLNLTESKAKLLEGVKANSYIGGKLVLGNSTSDETTFSTPRKGLKQLQSIFPSPIKCRSIDTKAKSPKVVHRTYCKQSKRRGNKVQSTYHENDCNININYYKIILMSTTMNKILI